MDGPTAHQGIWVCTSALCEDLRPGSLTSTTCTAQTPPSLSSTNSGFDEEDQSADVLVRTETLRAKSPGRTMDGVALAQKKRRKRVESSCGRNGRERKSGKRCRKAKIMTCRRPVPPALRIVGACECYTVNKLYLGGPTETFFRTLATRSRRLCACTSQRPVFAPFPSPS